MVGRNTSMMTPESIDMYKKLSRGNGQAGRIPDRAKPINQARNKKTDPKVKFPMNVPEGQSDKAIHNSYEQMTQGSTDRQKRMTAYNGNWDDVLKKNKTNQIKQSP